MALKASSARAGTPRLPARQTPPSRVQTPMKPGSTAPSPINKSGLPSSGASIASSTVSRNLRITTQAVPQTFTEWENHLHLQFKATGSGLLVSEQRALVDLCLGSVKPSERLRILEEVKKLFKEWIARLPRQFTIVDNAAARVLELAQLLKSLLNVREDTAGLAEFNAFIESTLITKLNNYLMSFSYKEAKPVAELISYIGKEYATSKMVENCQALKTALHSSAFKAVENKEYFQEIGKYIVGSFILSIKNSAMQQLFSGSPVLGHNLYQLLQEIGSVEIEDNKGKRHFDSTTLVDEIVNLLKERLLAEDFEKSKILVDFLYGFGVGFEDLPSMLDIYIKLVRGSDFGFAHTEKMISKIKSNAIFIYAFVIKQMKLLNNYIETGKVSDAFYVVRMLSMILGEKIEDSSVLSRMLEDIVLELLTTHKVSNEQLVFLETFGHVLRHSPKLNKSYVDSLFKIYILYASKEDVDSSEKIYKIWSLFSTDKKNLDRFNGVLTLLRFHFSNYNWLACLALMFELRSIDRERYMKFLEEEVFLNLFFNIDVRAVSSYALKNSRHALSCAEMLYLSDKEKHENIINSIEYIAKNSDSFENIYNFIFSKIKIIFNLANKIYGNDGFNKDMDALKDFLKIKITEVVLMVAISNSFFKNKENKYLFELAHNMISIIESPYMLEGLVLLKESYEPTLETYCRPILPAKPIVYRAAPIVA